MMFLFIARTGKSQEVMMVPNHAEKQILISTGLIDNNRWQSRKSNICVKLHPSSLRRTVRTPHSSGFARLDLELSTSPSLGFSTSEKKRGGFFALMMCCGLLKKMD
jgi:hypothetical protein